VVVAQAQALVPEPRIGVSRSRRGEEADVRRKYGPKSSAS
jgi:hypothetical protein